MLFNLLNPHYTYSTHTYLREELTEVVHSNVESLNGGLHLRVRHRAIVQLPLTGVVHLDAPRYHHVGLVPRSGCQLDFDQRFLRSVFDEFLYTAVREARVK
jgi:hypothetical protein